MTEKSEVFSFYLPSSLVGHVRQVMRARAYKQDENVNLSQLVREALEKTYGKPEPKEETADAR